VLRVLHVVSGLEDGGAESLLYNICSTNSECSFCVVSMTTEGKYGKILREIGVDVFCLNFSRGRFSIKGILSYLKIIKDFSPDIVQSWMYHADLFSAIASILTKTNVVWGVHAHQIYTLKLKTQIIIKICAWMSYYIPKKIVFCSQNAADSHIDIGYCSDKIKVIDNGVNTEIFSPNINYRLSFRNRISVSHNAFLVGTVARWDMHKSHVTLIECASILKEISIDIMFVLVGELMDSSNDELTDLLYRFDVNDMFILVGKDNRIQNAMNAFDLHVLPSVIESFGNVLIEAMSCGVPCVATDIGMPSKIVSNTGWVVPPLSPIKMSEAILEAYKEKQTYPYYWSKRQQQSRKRIIDYYSIENTNNIYSATWLEATK